MTTPTATEIAAEVRGLLAKRQLRQPAVAAALHMSTMAISRRLRGEVSFTAEEIFAMSRFLNVPVASFFGEQTAA